ncbi:MAG: hypothetical protein ACE5H1_02000 [Thermodesulfobacteriota bacterium]
MKLNPNLVPKIGVGVLAIGGVSMAQGEMTLSTVGSGLFIALAATGAWEWGMGWIAKKAPVLKTLTAKSTGLKFDGTGTGG